MSQEPAPESQRLSPDASAGLYVHFPYCVSICNYCDFDRQATGFSAIPRYVLAVAQEIRAQRRRPVHSVFFGGGTPSLMMPEQCATILTAAAETFDLTPACEITLEANPGECTVERLSGFREVGVNRLSIGVQSLDDATLLALSRRHTADEARAAVAAARAAGFDNLSLDFMLGLAGMTVNTWLATLDAALEPRPEHLSCYVLTVDERVPMGRDVARGTLLLPPDDEIAEQYLATGRRLAEAGFAQYEVSNWSLPGRESRHNLTYWRDEPYIGVGAGAAGWVDGVRTKNTPSPKRYMASVAAGNVEHVEDERPDTLTQLGDALAVGLRLREGIDLDETGRRLGVDVRAATAPVLDELLEANCLEWMPNGRLRVQEDSILVTSELLVRLEGSLAGYRARQARPRDADPLVVAHP
ncbi:MAG: radical SAM family heme chaperone HemW [Chloroflexi bacterium]|nr:radical SAM family heme chaperone HemW [Chloroflexota bacterium]